MLDANRNGEKARRDHHLYQMMQEIFIDEKMSHLQHVFNSIRYTMDVLLTGRWLAFGMRWALFSDETVANFRRDGRLVLVAAIQVKGEMVELELDEMKAK